jgi:hypothetical protein
LNREPSYYRARLTAIADELKRETDEKRIRLLQNGFYPDYQPSQTSHSSHSSPDSTPLTFLELCSWDTWFAMYPEKICGETAVPTSRSFPLAVKASREDVIRTVTAGITKAQNRVRIAKAKLKLLKLNL